MSYASDKFGDATTEGVAGEGGHGDAEQEKGRNSEEFHGDLVLEDGIAGRRDWSV